MKSKVLQVVGLTSIVGVGFLNIDNGYAAGYEKAVMFSGKYAGIGGAAASSVAGSESLYFNPAGLGGLEGLSVSGNVSPTFNKYTAPIDTGGAALDTSRAFSYPSSFMIGYGVTSKLGVGVGYYIPAGNRGKFENVGIFSSATSSLVPQFQGDLTLKELSIGVGYEILEGLKIGAAYRILFVNADVAFSNSYTTYNSTVTINDLSATQYNGFRFGIQYAPKASSWGLGVEYRTEVQFVANGTSSGSLQLKGAQSALGVLTLTGGAATLGSTFPQELSLGGHYDLMPNWRVFAQYSFTEYQKNQVLSINGTLTNALVGSVQIPGVAQNWSNMNQYRFSTEYKGIPTWAFRAAYVYSSQVTPSTSAQPIFESPGAGNTVVIGAGNTILPNLEADLALEYSWASGTASGQIAGDYSVNVYAAHVGVTYQIL